MTTPARVGGANAAAFSITYTPVDPGSDLIITVIGYNANSVSSVSDSQGQTVETDFAFTAIYGFPGSLYVGVYRIHSALAGAHTLTVHTPGGWNDAYIFVDEVTNILGVDTGAGTIAGTSGDSATATTSSMTPTASDDYLHAIFEDNAASITFSAYTNGFTQGQAATSGMSAATAYLVDSTSGTAIDTGATLSASGYWAGLLVPYLFGITPTILSVNSSANIIEGSTNVAVTGGNFESGMTAVITQPNGVSVAQPFTFTDATSGTFDLVMEPSIGTQLAYTDAVYTTKFSVTSYGQNSSGFPVTLVPPAGNIFQTLASVNPNVPIRIETIPDLSIGDQIEASGNSSGTAAAPTGLVLNSDGTFQFTNGTWVNFYARAYIVADAAWTPWTEIVCTGLEENTGFF